MQLGRYSKFTLLALALFAGLLLLLALLPPAVVPGGVDLRLAGVKPLTGGGCVVTVVLTNGTLRPFNVVDAIDGNPAFILDSGDQKGMWLTPCANRLKINLPPGGSLTNTVLITNAPARFRLQAQVRDLALERRAWLATSLNRFLPERVRQKLEKRRARPDPTSEWVDTKILEQPAKQ